MAIDWYPGHMTKARREIAAAISGVDVVIEVVDARLPRSSSNPMLDKLRGSKPCLKLLNKHDLADAATTREWLAYFSAQPGVTPLALAAKQPREVSEILRRARQLMPHKGKPGRSLRLMVVGIPNVGKSTLINSLVGKSVAKVGDKPAITTCKQQVNLPGYIILDDTPGLLWPNLRDQQGALRLAASGAIGINAYDPTEVACFVLEFLRRRYSASLLDIYPFAAEHDEPAALLEAIGRRHGCLLSGGVDLTRAGEFVLRALRAGKFGRVTLEVPGDVVAGDEHGAETGEDETGGE